LRKVASRIGGSKSAVQRHKAAQKKRNQYPESAFWETEAGYTWLRLLVFAVLYHFGLGSHIGADKLEAFFKQIRIDKHAGLSAASLRRQMNQMEELLPQFQQHCEQQAATETRNSTVAMDETFQGDMLALVLMDLPSGYLILEETSDDRSFESWWGKAGSRLQTLGVNVQHAISDRAKALIKLAVDGFDCVSGADIFHAQQDISRWLGSRLGRHHKQAKVAYEQADAASKKDPKHVKKRLAAVDAELAYAKIQQDHEAYHKHLTGISDEIHPFSVQNNQVQRQEQIQVGLENHAQVFAKIAQSQEINDSKHTLTKFRNQFEALAANVEFWWLWILEIVTGLAIDEATQQWLLYRLLPVVYWHQQKQRTKNPTQRQKYKQAWEQALTDLQQDEFTQTLSDSQMQDWLTQADWMARQFHRSSSAVEGRNGCLSQMYHAGRGLTECRLRALTVIHNYGLKRDDGTTAAKRFFNQDFPDLFSWIAGEMGELPLHRNRTKRVRPNSLLNIALPA
jgi:hypothetical protein